MPKILYVAPEENPKVMSIANGLKPMQDLVGGYIENVTLENGVGLVCNEEGRLTGLPENRYVEETGCFVLGPFFISRYNDEGETVDVTDADIKKYTKRFTRAG